MRVVEILSILGLITILCPCAILCAGFPETYRISVAAMSWTWTLAGSATSFDVGPIQFFSSLPFTLFRLFFLLMVYRFYQSKTSKIRTLIVGVLAELQMSVVFFLLIVTSPFPTGSIPLFLPIPILLLAGALIIQTNPPPITQLWNDGNSNSCFAGSSTT